MLDCIRANLAVIFGKTKMKILNVKNIKYFHTKKHDKEKYMRITRVAIIDSGVSSDQANELYKMDTIGNFENPFDNIYHGSVVCNIIKNHSKNVIIRSIKITEDIEIQEDSLCAALRILLNDLDVDIVNISLGVVISEKIDEISDLCTKLRNNGIIVIAAFDNDGAMSYPAAFPSVLGVDVSPKCKLIGQYEYIEDKIINLRGFSGVLQTKIDNKVLSVSGTSFACALMTAKISNILSSGIEDYNSILDRLRLDAKDVIYDSSYKPISKIKRIRRAIIFPFNKEMHALLANQDLLICDIVGVFDPLQLGKVGRKLSDLLIGNLKNDFYIQNIMKLNWNDDFDTVILGHTRELSETLNFDYKSYITDRCAEHHKYLYSFDSVEEDIIDLDSFTPAVLEENVPQNRFGKLFQVPCPVLGVFGTSSKQGKFSLQLKLRRLFLNSKFHLAQIGTEPSSLLFGMEAVYPMGYDGIIPSNSRDAIITLNDLLKNSVDGDTDIVIVGAQSGSNVYSCQNLSLFPIETFNLLLATQPDAILLCVNVYDSKEYIYRTIRVLENMINTYVIALVISPISYAHIDSGLSRNTEFLELKELEKFKRSLEETIEKKIFILDFDKNCSDIFDYCIKILSDGRESE